MKTQLRNLLIRGHSLELKKEIIQTALKMGIPYACDHYVMTRFTINRYLLFKEDILNADESLVTRTRKPIRHRTENYFERYKQKFNPKNMRKKHPFVVITRYANSNYKLVCFRNKIEFMEADRLKPIDLWTIAKKQKLKCALSGLPLTPETVSVDHIIAVSKGGRNTPSNIRLVEHSINRMRNDSDDEEFLKRCARVTDYWRNK